MQTGVSAVNEICCGFDANAALKINACRSNRQEPSNKCKSLY